MDGEQINDVDSDDEINRKPIKMQMPVIELLTYFIQIKP